MDQPPRFLTYWEGDDRYHIRADHLPFNAKMHTEESLCEELKAVAPLLAEMLRRHFADAHLEETLEPNAIDVCVKGKVLAEYSVRDASPFQEISDIMMRGSILKIKKSTPEMRHYMEIKPELLNFPEPVAAR